MKLTNTILFLFLICAGCNQQSKEEQAKELFEQVSLDMKTKSYQEAIKHINVLIELAPSVVEYQQMKIAILLEADEISTDEAKVLLNELDLKNANKRLTETMENLIVSTGEASEETIQHYKKRINGNPNYYENYHLLGKELARLGRYKEAIAAFSKCLELEPNYRYAHGERGKAYYDMGDKERACKEWETPGGLSTSYSEKYCK